MNADGSAARPVTDNPCSLDDYGPDWSPDGTRIAFKRGGYSSQPPEAKGLFTIRPDGTGLSRIPNSVDYSSQPAWSPDGARITFARDNGIFVMNADGSGERQIVPGQTAVATHRPSWQPLPGGPPPPPPPDTTPPSTPANLTAAAGNRSIGLTWTASTDTGGSGLAGYEVWRSTSGAAGSFVKRATTASTTYTDAGLKRGKTYWYHVVAYDGAGNRSGPSSTASATAK